MIAFYYQNANKFTFKSKNASKRKLVMCIYIFWAENHVIDIFFCNDLSFAENFIIRIYNRNAIIQLGESMCMCVVAKMMLGICVMR